MRAMVDVTTEFGQRVTKRLHDERIIWLTTVDDEGVPQPRPVWFVWDGETFLLYSRPRTFKLNHIARNPFVSLNFDGNGQGGDIIVFTGTASIVESEPPAHAIEEYVKKYGESMERISGSKEAFSADYSVALRVTPFRLRGH